MTKKPKYQDYIDELIRGEVYGIFIDDTGSPGIKDAPDNFHPERKTWVAVIVPPSQIVDVMHQMPRALDAIKQEFGTNEFHFTDIYSGKKHFEEVELPVRLGLFKFMVNTFSYYKFPIIVQTQDPQTLANIHSQTNNKLIGSIPPFNFKKCEDLALFFLLSKLKSYLQTIETYPTIKARVFIDEGYKKNGTIMQIPTFEDVFVDGYLCFAESSSIYPIQLADFAAFSLNRVQLLGGRENRSLRDIQLLQILSDMAPNYINLEQRVGTVNQQGALFTLADTRPNGP